MPGMVAEEKLMRLSMRTLASKEVKNMREVEVLAVPGPPSSMTGVPPLLTTDAEILRRSPRDAAIYSAMLRTVRQRIRTALPNTICNDRGYK